MTEYELQLFQKAVNGDSEAFGQLIINYEKLIYTIAYRMFDNREDAKDMAQETILKAYRNIKKCREPAAFKGWLCRIASNTCLDEVRKRKNKRTNSLDAALSTADGELSLQIPDDSPAPDDMLIKQETMAAVRQAVAKLPEQQRLPIILRDMEGLSYEEVAQAMGVPLGTVKSKISRARGLLRRILEEGGEQL